MLLTKGKYFLKYYPQHMILLSLIFSTLIGTLLLYLPACHTTEVNIIDVLFTATSLTTVTGALTIPIDQFTWIGHLIMLFLMQLGGLGVMTLSLFFLYIFSNLGIYTQVVASEVLSLKSFKDTKQTLFFIIKLTLVSELIGALIIFPTIYKLYPLKKAIFYSIFHAVSSFCNAGFVLFPEDFITFANHSIMVYITAVLMLIGGLGFVTWHELINKIFKKHNNGLKLSWHTKLVLRMYGLTALATSTLFFLLERNHTLANMSFFEKISTSLFTGIALKSTGLSLVTFASLQVATILVAIVTMFIGSAPLSTGSGIKTSVFAIYLAVIKAAIQGKRNAMLYHRHIVDDQVYKAIAIIALSLSWIFSIIFILSIIETDLNFLDVVFTTFSTFCNNGIINTSITKLAPASKLLLACSMIIGRVGALAVILSMKRIGEIRDLSYPKEHVILG